MRLPLGLPWRILMRRSRLIGVVTLFVVLVTLYVYKSPHRQISAEDEIPWLPTRVREEYKEHQQLLNCLTNGHFVPNANHNAGNVASIMKTIHGVWDAAGVPRNLSRRDGRCGNVGYEKVKVYRALCDPAGAKPCCHENACVSRTREACDCARCRDMRKPIHPEFSDYKMHDATCGALLLDIGRSKQACAILKRKGVTNIITFGDSLMRHVHIAMLIHLKNDKLTGALDPKAGQDVLSECSGLNQFTEKVCREHIQVDAKVCDDQVTVKYQPCTYAENSGGVIDKVKSAPKSTLIVGSVGLHENLMADVFIPKFFVPILNTVASSFYSRTSYFDEKRTIESWPKFIFMSPHLPGLLKGPEWDHSQNADYTRRYVKRMADFFETRNVLVLNTHPFCENAFSWDGTHYGKRFNLLVSEVFFSFLNSI